VGSLSSQVPLWSSPTHLRQGTLSQRRDFLVAGLRHREAVAHHLFLRFAFTPATGLTGATSTAAARFCFFPFVGAG